MSVSMGATYACDRTINLVYDELDGWPLDARETSFVNHHVSSCTSCEQEVTYIREEDDFLDRLDWDAGSDDQFDFGDEDEWTQYNQDSNRSNPSPAPQPAQAADEEDDENYTISEASAGSGEEPVYEEADTTAATPGGHVGLDATGDEEDLDQDEDPIVRAPKDEAEEIADAIARANEEAEQEAEQQEERERMRASAERAADHMSDEDLGSLDEAATADDGLMPECAADGIDKAAASNGVQNTDQIQKDTEEIVRNSEGVQDAGKRGKVAVYRSTRGLTNKRNAQGVALEPSNAAAAVIRNAILRSRTGHTEIELHQARGRLDSKGLWRIAERDPNLFKRRHAPSPAEYLIWVMVDVSGSMSGYPVAQLAQVARALAEATSGTPNVRMAIWAWSDPFLASQRYHSAARAGVCKVWETGMATSEVQKMTELSQGGTPDSTVLAWAWRNILNEKRGDELPVIIFGSDGQGDVSGMKDEVLSARKHQVLVRSLAIGGYLRPAYQEAVFGRGNFTPWAGSVFNTARPLANVVAQLATSRV